MVGIPTNLPGPLNRPPRQSGRGRSFTHLGNWHHSEIIQGEVERSKANSYDRDSEFRAVKY